MDKPIIVRCDDEDLMAAMRAIHGQRVEVFVLDHNQTGETLMVLLPDQESSLAAALRDWVDTWWTVGHDAQWDTPEQYLRGFGVVIEPGHWTAFATSCPYCGGADELEVVGGTFQTMGVRVSAEGFAFADASMMQTEDEEIQCNACHRTFSADAIRI